jgi:hypothetical protein
MKKTSDSNSNSNRRKFLTLGLLGGAGLISQKASAMLPKEEEEKVSMLTPDGKLVEVSKRVLDQIEDRKKAANQDILDWTTAENKTAQ